MQNGLAHGGVTDFTDTGVAIAPDRDRSARLYWLALGDWHGRTALSDRVQYSGTPHQDRFKNGRRGVCLCVGLNGPGAPPKVEEFENGTVLWQEIALTLHLGQYAAAALSDALPASGRRELLNAGVEGGYATAYEQREYNWDFIDDLALAHRAAPEAHLPAGDHGLRIVHRSPFGEWVDRAAVSDSAARTASRCRADRPSLRRTQQRHEIAAFRPIPRLLRMLAWSQGPQEAREKTGEADRKRQSR